MNGTGDGRRRFFFLLAPLMLGAIAIPAARSDAAEAANPTPAQVADGLKVVQRAADEVAEYAGTDKAKAQKEWDEAHEAWEGIENAIRANDKDAYIAFEDALDGLKAAAKAGDAKKAEEGAEAIAKASKAYLAKFPGDAAAKPAPAPVPDPAPAAKPAPAPVPDAAATAAGRTAAAAPAAAAATTPAPAAKAAPAPAAEPAPASTLARTGSGSSALAALAGLAFGLGGLAVIGGARRRRVSPLA